MSLDSPYLVDDDTYFLNGIISSLGQYTRDAIIITEAEPFDEPGPRIVWVNEAFSKISGYAKEDVIGQNPRLLHGPDTSEETKHEIGRNLRQWKDVRTDILNYKKDGTPFWVELSIQPVADETGWYRYWVSVQREVTDRKQQEIRTQRLQNQLANTIDSLGMLNARYDLALAASNAGFFDWDVTSNHLHWSDKFKSMIGLKNSDFEANFTEFDKRLHPDDRAHTLESVRRHLEDKVEYNVEYRLQHEDGHYFWVHARGQAIWDAFDKPIRMVGSMEDITQRIEDQKKLKAAIAKAEVANKAKSAFLANMSHEIRTPLNGILGVAQVMKSMELEGDVGSYIDLILESGDRLQALLGHILDLSRIEAEAVEIEPEDIQLKSKIESLTSTHCINAREKGLECILTLNFNDDLVVKLDPTKLGQIIENLLSNAVKFTEQGHINVIVTHHSLPTPSLEIIIEDTGPGISKDHQSKVFERFVQVDMTLNRKYEGSGLGLSIVKGLVDLLGGSINLSSTLYKGSRFTVHLPVETTFGFDKVDHKSILVVEDNRINIQTMKLFMHELGYEADYVCNGLEAVERFKQQPYKVILMDIEMPVKSGLDAAKEIRTLPYGSGCTIIAQTGHVMTEQMDSYTSEGFDAVLPKPIALNELKALLIAKIKSSKSMQEQ